MGHFSSCLVLLLLVVFPYLILASDTEISCPSAIASDCKCYENSESRLRIRCSDTTFGAIKSALIDDSIHTDVWKLEFVSFEDTVLAKDYFKDFTALIDFESRFGEVHTIEPGAFNGASTLEKIDLSYNVLTWLSGDMFDGLTSSMVEMLLQDNELEYLYSDMEEVFVKVSTLVKLSSNPLNCSCQIQWLADLLQSDKSLPEFEGATCTDTNSVKHSMETTTTQFECADICTDGFHNCSVNETCLLDTATDSFTCNDNSGSGTSSSAAVFPPSPSPSAVPVDISSTIVPFMSSSDIAAAISSSPAFEQSPSPSFNQAMSSSSSAVVSSPVEYYSTTTGSSLPLTTTYSSSSQSTIHVTSSKGGTSTFHATSSKGGTSHSQSADTSETPSPSPFPSYLPPSPSPTGGPDTIPPEECGTSLCDSNTESCTMSCGQCPYCSCNEGFAWGGNDNLHCITPSTDAALCVNDDLIGLAWPSVTGGSTIAIPCCSTSNICSTLANRTCSPEGEWTDFFSNGCISASVFALLNSVLNGDGEAIANLTSSLVTESSNQQLLQEDLVQLSNLVTQLVEQLDPDNVDPQVITDIVQTVSNLLDEEHTDTWQEEDTINTIITQLFVSIETLGTILPVTNGTTTFKTDNLALQVIIPDGSETSGWNISSSLLNGTSLQGHSSIHIPGSLVMDALGGQDLEGCNVRVIASLWDVDPSFFTVNSSAAGVVDEPPLVHGMCKWSDGSTTDSTALFVNSLVISASLYSSNCSLNTSNLSKPIQITLHHANQSLENPTCSFLEPTEDSDGNNWANEGCRVSSLSNSNQTVCECFHLTSFALLMSPTGSVSISQPLIIATKVGLSVSILALIVTCILLFGLKLESKLNIVHRQLALALCLSQFVFLVGVDRVSIPYPDAACTAIAALLHYLLLCTFAWELVEGIHLYLFIVKVFYNKKIIWSYFPLAWGVPLVIVAVTLGLNFCEYGSQNFCWITTGQGTNWAFHGPVLVVIAVNIVMLVIISGVVIRSVRRKDPDSCGLCKLLQASFILVPTLGLTWVLGFFVVGEDDFALVIEWMFFVLTTLQGLLIFTIHCVLNTEVRASFLKALGFKQAARKQKSVFALNPVAAINSMAASGFRRLSGARRGSLEPLAASEDGGSNGLGLTAQQIKDLQSRVGFQLATVNEEGDEQEPDIETEMAVDNKSQYSYKELEKFKEDSCYGDSDTLDGIGSSTNLLLTTSPPVSTVHTSKTPNMEHKPEQRQIDTEMAESSQDSIPGPAVVDVIDNRETERRSSTDGLLDEEMQGLYQFNETTQQRDNNDEAIGHGDKLVDVVDQESPDVARTKGHLSVADNEETELQLVGFALGIDTCVGSTISIIPADDNRALLQTRSYSCIEDANRHSAITIPSPEVKRSDSTSKLSTAKLRVNATGGMGHDRSNSVASSIVMMNINEPPLDNMEELLIQHTRSADDLLMEELNDDGSHASLLY